MFFPPLFRQPAQPVVYFIWNENRPGYLSMIRGIRGREGRGREVLERGSGELERGRGELERGRGRGELDRGKGRGYKQN